MVFEKDNKEYLAEKEDLQERGGTDRANASHAFQQKLSVTTQISTKAPAISHVNAALSFRSLPQSLMRDGRGSLQHHNAMDHF